MCNEVYLVDPPDQSAKCLQVSLSKLYSVERVWYCIIRTCFAISAKCWARSCVTFLPPWLCLCNVIPLIFASQIAKKIIMPNLSLGLSYYWYSILTYSEKCVVNTWSGRSMINILTQCARPVRGAALQEAVGVWVACPSLVCWGPIAKKVLEPHDREQVQDLAFTGLVSKQNSDRNVYKWLGSVYVRPVNIPLHYKWYFLHTVPSLTLICQQFGYSPDRCHNWRRQARSLH